MHSTAQGSSSARCTVAVSFSCIGRGWNISCLLRVNYDHAVGRLAFDSCLNAAAKKRDWVHRIALCSLYSSSPQITTQSEYSPISKSLHRGCEKIQRHTYFGECQLTVWSREASFELCLNPWSRNWVCRECSLQDVVRARISKNRRKFYNKCRLSLAWLDYL